MTRERKRKRLTKGESSYVIIPFWTEGWTVNVWTVVSLRQSKMSLKVKVQSMKYNHYTFTQSRSQEKGYFFLLLFRKRAQATRLGQYNRCSIFFIVPEPFLCRHLVTLCQKQLITCAVVGILWACSIVAEICPQFYSYQHPRKEGE